MSMQLVSANHATALAVTRAATANRSARGFGSGVYPITPQSESIELLCKQVIDKGSVVRVESEHSAMAVCMGYSIAGLRTFTASSSNGLAYMTENIFSAAMYRLPIVMMAVNRTLGPPWNIWVDHSDTLMLRDAGWLQFYCEDNQEVVDSMLAAYRLAEDARILLPVLVCQDAFVLSHTMMMTDIPEQDVVDRFLPTLNLPHRITDAPRTIGGLDFPHETEVHRREHSEAMDRVFAVYPEVQRAFAETFGRELDDFVVGYKLDDADVVLVSMGTMASTVRTAVDAARARGLRAGGLRIRMFRPFPDQALRSALAGAKRIGVLDRNLAPGIGGIVWSELRGLAPADAIVQDYIVGIGGGDVRPTHITGIIEDLEARQMAAAPKFVEVGS